MALSTFQQQPKQLCYIQTQNKFNNYPNNNQQKYNQQSQVNSQQCYYYHNNACHTNQCQFCAITSSQWKEHLFTKEESDLDSQSLSNSFKWELLHRVGCSFLNPEFLCLLNSSNLSLPKYDEKRTLYCNNLALHTKNAQEIKTIVDHFMHFEDQLEPSTEKQVCLFINSIKISTAMIPSSMSLFKLKMAIALVNNP